MPYWITDLDSKGGFLMFGSYPTYDRAEKYKDRSCNRFAVIGEAKSRDKGTVSRDLKIGLSGDKNERLSVSQDYIDDVRELLGRRHAILASRKA